jgi:thiol-disulfide isomerase/thioredoxin
MKPKSSPDALLFVTPGCPHCAAVLRGLEELAAQGRVGELTVIDATEHPGQAAEYGVRAAPWLRLGPFTLTGSHSPAELRQWAEWASGEEGTTHYVEYLLEQGGYQQAAAFVDADVQRLGPLLAIVADPEEKLQVRLGVSALLEAHANTAALQNLLPRLAELSRHADHRVRADACHLLGLTNSPAARDAIEACLNDGSDEVREIAEEALERLGMHH